MKNQITFKGGLALMAMSLIFLSSCKKEEITSKTPVSQSGNQNPAKHDYKFSAVAKIPGEKPENGFLSLTVSSDDEAFLKKYVAKLEQTKIVMAEVSSTQENKEDVKPLFNEEESTSSVGLDFNWDNFSFDRQKGKMYHIRMASADQSKGLVYYTAYSNSNGFTSSWGYAAVNVYSQYRYWEPAEFRYYNSNNCNWKFHNTQSYFYTESAFSYHANLELRCFQASASPIPSNYYNFGNFTINGYTTFYRPRVNYVSPEMPSGYVDMSAITAAIGLSNYNGEAAPADITLYIVG